MSLLLVVTEQNKASMPDFIRKYKVLEEVIIIEPNSYWRVVRTADDFELGDFVLVIDQHVTIAEIEEKAIWMSIHSKELYEVHKHNIIPTGHAPKGD